MPDIWGTTRVLGVIGYPVRHSFSPPMQNAALAALGLDYVYVPFEIAPDDLPAAVKGFQAAGLVGFNATIPHKQALLPLVDEATAEAELTGTVNTVHFVDGRIVGDSTDGPGFVAGLAAAGGELDGRRVVLLGAGGSARAVGVSLVRHRVAEVLVVNRTRSRAEDLVALLNSQRADWPAKVVEPNTAELDEAVAEADLVLNTTSVGMHPHPGEAPHRLRAVKPGAWVVDLIYNPLRTEFLQQAAALGAATLNGVEMLVYQGALSLARWTGCETPPVAVMRDVLLAELARRAGR